ncbi:SMP-30/gluconolactonase/LRE family protein [Lentisphaera araneosa]|nr:SMP-30/gluconolactonase/LRE family protein [Lentisphaera araneosa]
MNTKFIFIILFLSKSLLWGADDLVFAKGSQWEVLSVGHKYAEGMAWDSEGNFYFTDVPRSQLFKIDRESNQKTLVVADTGVANGIAFGPDGRLYGCARDAIASWNTSTWEAKVHGVGAHSNDLAILDDGTLFYTDPKTHSIWRLDGKSKKRSLALSLKFRPNGLTLSPDKKTLLVAAFFADTIYAFPINDFGKVEDEAEVAYVLATPSNGRGLLDGMQVLPNGKLVAGTALGIQIVEPHSKDKRGSIILIPSPVQDSRCNYVRISPDGKWLYGCFVKEVRRRRIELKLTSKE